MSEKKEYKMGIPLFIVVLISGYFFGGILGIVLAFMIKAWYEKERKTELEQYPSGVDSDAKSTLFNLLFTMFIISTIFYVSYIMLSDEIRKEQQVHIIKAEQSYDDKKDNNSPVCERILVLEVKPQPND